MAEHRDIAPADELGIMKRWRLLSPVRFALYPVVVAVVALLVGYGVVTVDRAPLWLAVAAACLGIAGTEFARGGAWSPASVADRDDRWANLTVDEYARGVADALHATPDAAAGMQRCRDVRGGSPCELALGHEGWHLIRTT